MPDDEQLVLCACCAMKLLNDDESTCRDYYNHTHPSCDVPSGTILASLTPIVHTSARPLDCDGHHGPIADQELYWPAVVPAL
ncbi:MAG: hypothetical protein E7G28_13065 [Cutibacterium avidum]|nr:hypothetical protein [Cutibacterium avidum]MDU3750048.1 hypothetical protein [Cutibacterium avidum]